MSIDRMKIIFDSWDSLREETRLELGEEFKRRYRGDYTLRHFLDFLEEKLCTPGLAQTPEKISNYS